MNATGKAIEAESPLRKGISMSQKISELASLSATTFVLIATFVTNWMASTSRASSFGFKNTTGAVSSMYRTQTTPAGFTFVIWGFIYTWQALWIAYAWSFVCRSGAVRSIPIGAYWMYAVANVCNITWLYVWGNVLIKEALGVLIPLDFALYSATAMLWVYFYRNAESVRRSSKIDYWLTWFLPVNGVMVYATWSTVAMLGNLGVVLQYFTNLSAANGGTVVLSLLAALVVTYFFLENSILDRFTRYVFSVYPVVVWALIGILSAHWGKEGQERNAIFTLVLLIVVLLLVVARIILSIVFTVWRPEATFQMAKVTYV